MTTAVAAGAYPFLAEGGLGAEGIYIGRDVHAEASFVFDPFALYGRVEGFTNPNLLLAGVIGQGKSALAKSFALRSVAFGYRVYVPCDPKGEWTPVAEALGGRTVALGPGLPGRLNPLDAAPRPESVAEADWVGEIRKRRLLLLGSLARTVLGRDLMPMEHTALDVALDAVVTRAADTHRTPLLGEIAATLNNPHALDEAAGMMSGQLGDAARDLAHAMRRLVHGDLAGMFDAPSTVAFDPNAPMLTIDLSRLGGSGDDTALVLAMTCASAWMESALSDPGGGRRWIVYDEAWRLMRHVGLLQRMQAQWKLSRGLGIANLMVIHRLSDLLASARHGRGRTAVRDVRIGLHRDRRASRQGPRAVRGVVLRPRQRQVVHPPPGCRAGPLVRCRPLQREGRAPSRLAVFAEQPQHKRWEMVSVVDLDSQKLPDVALDREGYATAVAATGNKHLAADADVLRTAVLDNFTTGGTNTGSTVFAPTEASKRQVKVHSDAATRFGNKGSSVFDAADNPFTDAYALKTADGGALILFSHTHTQTDAVAHSGLQINPGKEDRAWLHDVPRTSIRYTFVCNDAATVPAKAEPSRLIGYTCARTDASGPPVPSWSHRA